MDKSADQFDLHGCFVFDNFFPISCPPRKGLEARFKILCSREQIEETIKIAVPTSIQVPQRSWNTHEADKSPVPDPVSAVAPVPDPVSAVAPGPDPVSAVALVPDPVSARPLSPCAPCLCVIPIDVPVFPSKPEPKSSLRLGELSAPVSSELQGIGRSLAEKRAAWMDHVVGILARKNKPLSAPPVEEQSDPVDAEHFGEFLVSLPVDGVVAGDGALRSWVQDVMTLLRAAEAAGCPAVVLVGLGGEQQNIGDLFPMKFRVELVMPAVFVNQKDAEFEDVLALTRRAAINRVVVTPIPLQPGDHIYREIREKGALKFVKHHGIYTGNGRIIHFSGNETSLKKLLFSSKKAMIRTASIIRFMKQGSRLKIMAYSKSDPPSVVIQRAEEAFMDQTFGEYSLLSNNCEHFCHYCKKKGSCRSKQVEKGLAVATAAIAAVGVIAGVAIMAAKKR